MSKQNKKHVRNYILDQLKEGDEGPVVVMICRIWDVHNINDSRSIEGRREGPIVVIICRKWDMHNNSGRYLSKDFVISDEQVK